MRHADEGTMHSYLDGELSPAEVTELERHLSVCAPCRALLTEARGFMTEADQLVVALDVVVPAARTVSAPVTTRRWRPRMSTLAWAATIVVAVGVGYSLRLQLDRPTTAVGLATSPADQPLADSPAVTAVAPPVAEQPSAKSAAPRDVAPSRPTHQARQAPDADLASATATPPSAPQPATGGRVDELGNGAAAALQRQGEPTRAASPVAGASGVALVEGTPVDTTLRRSLRFGPPNTPAPRRITLDEAVTQLGGSIRLIDGLAPQRVELLSGVDVAGADPDRQVVRIYYEEPDLGLITLDQQRPGPSFAARDGREDRNEATSALPTVTVAPFQAPSSNPTLGRVQVNTVAWRADGVWLALTSHRPGVKMDQLQARVK